VKEIFRDHIEKGKGKREKGKGKRCISLLKNEKKQNTINCDIKLKEKNKYIL
jgi:hypothetical protein